MTIDDMKNHSWQVSWSGGKDSTATIILMHEYNIPIESITYVRMMYDENTPATLPIMTDFVENAIKVFESWGYKVNIVPSIKTAKQIYTKVYKRSRHQDRNGKPYGITAFARGACIMTSIKQQTINKLKLSEYQMLGYACDEKNRIHRLTDKKCSILVELKIAEIDTYDICRKYGLLSPLYDLGITRDGCFFCPNAGKMERELINTIYPELKAEIVSMIEMCEYDIESFIKSGRNTWMTEYTKESRL